MSNWLSLTNLPILVWIIGIILSLKSRRRNPKKYLLTLLACSVFLASEITSILVRQWYFSLEDRHAHWSTYHTLSTVTTILGVLAWVILFYAIFNPTISATETDKTPTTEKLPYLKTALIGMGTGVIGAIVGFFPILFLHYRLWDLVKNTTMSGFLLRLVVGYTMPWQGVIFVPIGGAVFGCIGSLIGLKMHSRWLWLWGGVAGLLFNLFVSFSAQ
jgi:hypothetical protein